MSHFPITASENRNFNTEAKGTVIKISIVDNDIADVVVAGFNRLVVERSTNGGLTWATASVPSEQPALVPTQIAYEWRDRSGDSSYQYRVRYRNSTTDDLTDPSDAIEGVGLAIRNILTVPELKARYLFGLDLTNDAGETLTDDVFEHYIMSAIRWLEHQIDISILPTQFIEKHDYYVQDFAAFQFIQLDQYPVIEVSEFRVQYPSGQNIIQFPPEWFRVNAAEGHVQIIPTAGTLSEILIGQGGSFLPAIYTGLQHLPQLFEITYTAGFEDGKIPRNIIDVIGMFASLGPFNIFGDLIAGAGIATISLSLDGLSQNIGTTSSATNAGYGSRIIQYLKQIKEQIPMLRRYYKRVGGMVVV